MVENFEVKGGYGVYKLRPQLGNFKMENNLQPCPVMEEFMLRANPIPAWFVFKNFSQFVNIWSRKMIYLDSLFDKPLERFPMLQQHLDLHLNLH